MQNETKATSNVYSFQSGSAESGVKDEALLNVLMNPSPSPFLYVEKSCEMFGKRVYDGLSVISQSADWGFSA
jgi:hypothetical protein